MIINNILSAKMLRNLCGVRLSFLSGVKFNTVRHYLDAEWATDQFKVKESGVFRCPSVGGS